MVFKFTGLILIIIIQSWIIVAQETWTLERCLTYAAEHNLTVKSKQVDLLIAEIQHKQLRLNTLPSANMGGTHGFNWGQSIDPFTNQFASDRIRTNNLYASGNWDIFSGLQNYHQLKRGKLNVESNKYELEILRRNLNIDISAAYMQVVLNQYLIEEARNQIEYVLNSQKLANELFQHGHVTHYDVLAIRSQLSMDSITLIQSENNRSFSLILLKQFLNLEEIVEIEIPSIHELETEIHNESHIDFHSNFEFELAKIQSDIRLLDLRLSKARLLPTLAISGSIGSGFSGNNTEFVGSQFLPKPFDVQIQENFYQSSVLTLTVPVFNNGRIRSEIKIAEAEIAKNSIEREIMFQEFRYQIEQLENEILNEKVNVNALKNALHAIEERFEASSKQYEAGTLNIQNYLDIKNDLFRTRAEYCRALIILRFKKKMLALFF